MKAICVTCGTQFAETTAEPEHCPICEDERQYVGLDGQQWTTLERLAHDHHTLIREEEAGLSSYCVEPRFGIGQRAFVIQTPAGNLLWDCLSLFDEAALGRLRAKGGIQAIAISHPHYYTAMVEWSAAFGDAPIYVHADDRAWVMRPSDSIRFWTGETQELFGGLTIVRCGGHFPGACVLHWPAGAEGRGALLTGDTIQVGPDLRSVSFMWSYPNCVPLGAREIGKITAAITPFKFSRLYGSFPKMTIAKDGQAVIERSKERYLAKIRPL